MKVDFMIAGVQKGGTTAMFETLREHPQVGMPARKEPHFFDNDRLDWHEPDYGRLHKLYEPGRQVYGEATPITCYWTPAHERIRAYNGAMRFVLLFRDPVERAYSHWCMEFARGTETLTFAQAIREGRARIKANPRRFSYVERGFYASQMTAMRDALPEARFLYLLSDDLIADRTSALARLAEFIGVDAAQFPQAPIIARERKAVRYPSVITKEDNAYLMQLYEKEIADLAALTGLDLTRWGRASAHSAGQVCG